MEGGDDQAEMGCISDAPVLVESEDTRMEEAEAVVVIDGAQVRNGLKEMPSEPLDELVKEAFRQACDHAIFAYSEGMKQRAGLAGVLMILKDREEHELYAKVERELTFWKAMNAATTGVPVDFARVAEEFGDPEDTIGISDCWNQVMEERK